MTENDKKSMGSKNMISISKTLLQLLMFEKTLIWQLKLYFQILFLIVFLFKIVLSKNTFLFKCYYVINIINFLLYFWLEQFELKKCGKMTQLISIIINFFIVFLLNAEPVAVTNFVVLLKHDTFGFSPVCIKHITSI